MQEKTIEQQIEEKGMTAPRITPEHIEMTIVGKAFHRLTDVLTVCVLTLLNGFTVTGESACASPENFDQEIGENIAYKNAKEKVWMLEGYRLKQFLACNPNPFQAPTPAPTMAFLGTASEDPEMEQNVFSGQSEAPSNDNKPIPGGFGGQDAGG